MRISDWSSDVCSSDLTILVLAQHGLVGPMDTPLDISYLSDAVVTLRYFEVGGSVRRALSVVKKRSGNHEHTIREFQLTPEGIAVGPRSEARRVGQERVSTCRSGGSPEQ